MRTLAYETEKEEPFSLKETIFLFWQRKWLVLNFMVITLTLVSIYAFRLPDEYTASSQVLIEEMPQVIAKAQTEEIALSSISDRYYQAQAALLVSFPVLKGVVEQLGLQEKLAASKTQPLSMEDAIARVKAITIVAYKEIIYTISVKHTDPFMAASISNAIAKTYVKQYLEGRLYLSKEIIELFPKESQELKKFTSQGKLEQLSKEDLITKLPSVQQDPTIKTLQEKKYFLENEISKLSLRYKEKHPKMIELRTSLYFVNERLTARTASIVGGLKEKLVNKFQESNIKILSEASIPGAPSGPNRPRIIILVGLVAFAVSLGLVVLLDTLDDRINNEDDLERYIQLPFLGSIFRIKKVKDEFKKDTYVMHEPLSETAEAFKALRVNINFATAAEHRKTLLVTSTSPQEGKTFVAANLAISKAQDGKKILLVDADLRRPRVHKVFGLENRMGLSNILTTYTPLAQAIQKTSVENLDVITSGPPSPNPPEIFASKAMAEFLRGLEGKYETVIFDAPPSFGIPDVLVLGNMVGSTVLVVRAHKTSYKLIVKTKKHLQEKEVRIIGAVLNTLEPSKGKSYYYDYKHYGYSYSREKGQSASLPS